MFKNQFQWVAAVAVAAVLQGSLAHSAEPTIDEAQVKLERMEREQRQLLRTVKKQLEELKDSPRREELKQLAAEIEARMKSEPRILYLSPNSNMTTEMQAYHKRVIRRMEDCGTRNFPKRDGKSVYGKGMAAVTLDQSGRATKTEILESSGERILDVHFGKVVQASSPFGVLPKRLTPTQASPYQFVVLVTSFQFGKDESPVEPIEERERCKWP